MNVWSNNLHSGFVSDTMAIAQSVKPSAGNPQVGIALLIGYRGLYTCMLLVMRRANSFDISEPLLVLSILGAGFSGAAWLCTLHVRPLNYPVVSPGRELAIVAAWLVVGPPPTGHVLSFLAGNLVN